MVALRIWGIYSYTHVNISIRVFIVYIYIYRGEKGEGRRSSDSIEIGSSSQMREKTQVFSCPSIYIYMLGALLLLV